jgi:hypothetical protein
MLLLFESTGVLLVLHSRDDCFAQFCPGSAVHAPRGMAGIWQDSWLADVCSLRVLFQTVHGSVTLLLQWQDELLG